MAVAIVVTVVVVIFLLAGAASERERRREKAVAYEAAGIDPTAKGEEYAKPSSSTSEYRDIGARLTGFGGGFGVGGGGS